MNNFSPTRGKLPQAAVWTALLAVLAQLCWLQLQPNSALSASVAQLKSPTRALGVCQESDELAAQVGPGNLFLHIVGCPKTDPNAEATHTFSEFRDFSLSVWYFRMNYDLYPRRVFAASPDTVINGGSDLMGLTFFPRPGLAFSTRRPIDLDPRIRCRRPDAASPVGEIHRRVNHHRRQLMAPIFCCLYGLLILLIGYFIYSLLRVSDRVTLSQGLGLVPALGAGALGLLLFWLSCLGLAPSRLLLGILGFTALAGLLLLARLGRCARWSFAIAWGKSDWLCLVPGFMILLAVGGMAAASLSAPLVDWDAFAIWGFKAKVLFHEALHPPPPYFHDLTLSYSHLDYPLLLPFLTAGAYAAIGSVDDQVGKLVSVGLDVLIVPMIYLGLRWKLGRLPALCLCAALVWLPPFLRFGGTGCADLPLAMFYAGSILYVARWIDRQQRVDLVLAILFSAFTAFTKNEGQVLALINGVVILLFGFFPVKKSALGGGVVFFAGLLLLESAWLVWSRSLPHTHENYGPKLMSAQLITSLPKLNQIGWAMILQITNSSVWGWVWLLTGVVVWLGRRAFLKRPVLALWCLLGLHILAYALVYCVTPWNLTLLLATSLDRLLWHVIPVVFLLVGWHWAEVAAPDTVAEEK